MHKVECADVRLPDISIWSELDVRERERRTHILANIQQRIDEDGPHQAIGSAQRGRLFMPFSALKGYDELVRDVEDAQNHQERW